MVRAVSPNCRIRIAVERSRPLNPGAYATRYSPEEWRLVENRIRTPLSLSDRAGLIDEDSFTTVNVPTIAHE
jgi:hypothetical protein